MALDVSHMKTPKSKAMAEFFDGLGQDAFRKNHWELAAISTYSADEWRTFLTDPVVAKFTRDEINAIAEMESRKIIMDVSKNARSTGTAQTLVALDKTRGSSGKKDGPVFVYTYIPLNERELNAANVQIAEGDPFRVTKE